MRRAIKIIWKLVIKRDEKFKKEKKKLKISSTFGIPFLFLAI